jgi:hypothetical protein
VRKFAAQSREKTVGMTNRAGIKCESSGRFPLQFDSLFSYRCRMQKGPLFGRSPLLALSGPKPIPAARIQTNIPPNGFDHQKIKDVVVGVFGRHGVATASESGPPSMGYELSVSKTGWCDRRDAVAKSEPFQIESTGGSANAIEKEPS